MRIYRQGIHLLRNTAWAVGLAMVLGVPGALGAPEITDAEITQAVDTELLLSKAVPSHLIDVSVADGIVELTGSVDNILARKRATEIAETIKGVRAVVNRILVNPVPRSD